MGMSRLKRSAAVLIAIGGLVLMGTAFHGLVEVDGTLQAATRNMRNQQRQTHQTIDVTLHRLPGCQMPQTQRL